MYVKLFTILMLFALMGCQQKSEIDKCVEAVTAQKCNEVSEYGGKYKRFYELMDKSESQCVELISKTEGGDVRKECLKAQLGNK